MAQGSLKFWVQVSAIATLLAGACFAEKEEASDVSTGVPDLSNIKVGGYTFWQSGQWVHGLDRDKSDHGIPAIDHWWTSSALIGFWMRVKTNDMLQVVISPEFYLGYPYPPDQNVPASMRPFGAVYINEGKGVFSFGDADKPIVQAELGMFKFKYNPDAKNLGEYIFRTGTYPTYIITNFDFPLARLLGLHLSTDAIENFHVDILLTSEAFIPPLFDLSLTAIASYKFFKTVELGAGIDFARFIPVSSNKTSPEFPKDVNGGFYNEYITEDGKKAYYSFHATKLMGRISIDPKPFFGSPSFLGKEDCKLYGEITAVGMEGYKAKDLPDSGYRAWYNDLAERTPVMIGFNVPTFKMCDVLSGELEYFPSRIPNDYSQVERYSSPMPYFKGGYDSYIEDEWNQGFLRWSVYAKRVIMNGFYLSGEIAFDHLRTYYWNGTQNDYESLIHKGHWHWDLKFGYVF